MRETINIIKYGFVLFLLTSGIASIFYTETYFVNSINSLSIPIFAFSISILFVKSNQYVRTEILKQIREKELIINNLQKGIDKKEKCLNKPISNSQMDEYKKGIDNLKEINQLYNASLISHREYCFFHKFFFVTDAFTRIFNVLATLSFSCCLLSLTGLFRITNSFAWINNFSLALVFFDFFILDDLMSKLVGKKIRHFREQAEKEIGDDEE